MAAESTPKTRGRLMRAVPRLSRFAAEYLLLLPLGAGIALVWANTVPESYFRFSYAAAFLVNDIAMAFFFALMTKEVVEATAPGGVLHPWRRAWLPVLASVGVTLVPAWLHTRLVEPLDEPMLAQGWPVTFAVDVALSYFVARLIFGARHPAVPFVIVMAIASDALGLLTLAAINPSRPLHPFGGIVFLVVAMALAAWFRRAGFRNFWPYLAGPGALAWFALYWSGLHPALALVPILPFLPHAGRDPGFFVDAKPGARDTLSQFELFWRYPAQVALFFFGLANAGVPLNALENGTWALPLAMLVGKPIGIVLGVGLAMLVGLHLPRRLTWRDLIPIGFTMAIGFSVGLFFTTALLPPGQLQAEISMGVLITVVLGPPLALATGWLLGISRGQPPEAPPAS